jgi:heme/copper-type cytochrome/quinol oxidase subunit 2
LRPSRRVLAALTVAVVAVAFVSTAYAFHLLAPGPPNCWARPSGAANTVIFTVVMANQGINVGYNGSRYHPFPWPVMNVSLGQNAVIHLVNNDTQAHGFTIMHFFESGIVVAPRECYDVRFTANTIGNFTVFCQIICSIHNPWMLNGRLNVNP